MKLSIVVPSYDDAHELNGFLTSAAHVLSKQKAEIIIQDGASNTDVRSLAEDFKSKLNITYTAEPDEGIYDAILKGVEKSQSDWILIMGSDDRLSTDITNLIEKLDDVCEIHYANVRFKNSGRIYDGPFSSKKLYLKNICQQSVIYPKKALNKLSEYRLDSMYCDYMLHINLWSDPDYTWIFHDLVIADFDESGVSSSIKEDYFYRHHRLLKEPLIEQANCSFLESALLRIINVLNMRWNQLQRK